MIILRRDRGADMTWEGCTLEEPWFFDHTCTTLADLEAMNCKRSKWEISRPGSKETCTQFNDIISCEMGECKNVSMIYQCTFQVQYKKNIIKNSEFDRRSDHFILLKLLHFYSFFAKILLVTVFSNIEWLIPMYKNTYSYALLDPDLVVKNITLFLRKD
jgi:hypothetical protein